MAILLSLFIPGLGQLYNGRPFQGLLWLCVVVAGYLMLFVPGLVLHVICLVDAARDQNRRDDKKMQRQAELMADAISRRK